MSGNKRIMKELADINANPIPGCQISLPQEDDIHQWEVVVDGPADSPYAGGKFIIQIKLPNEYPFKPPTLAFRTKIYHPNVANDSRGGICLGILKADEWKPPYKIVDVLRLVQTVLASPQPDDALELQIADQYKKDKASFEKTAKEWVAKYAS